MILFVANRLASFLIGKKNRLKDKNSLRKHMTRHAQASDKYTCNLCGKTAPNKDALQKHQRYSHYTDRIHQCSVCEKSFKKALLLKEHMTTHTGEVLYTCPYCPKTFNSSANRHAHKKKQHVELWAQESKARHWTKIAETTSPSPPAMQ